HVQRLRHRGAVWWLQGERLRPRDELPRHRALHAGQERVGRLEHVGAAGQPTALRPMITDAHIHVQPFHMMPAAVAATFWKGKDNRSELEGYAADPRKLLARMDADGIARVGLINYVSPDVMGFTDESNPWMIRYAAADPSRLIAFGSVNPRFSRDVAGDTARVIEAGARARKVHPP